MPSFCSFFPCSVSDFYVFPCGKFQDDYYDDDYDDDYDDYYDDDDD